MDNNTNWIENYGFILFAFAHMTDWKLLECELEVIQEKMEFIISNTKKDYNKEDIAANLVKIIKKYDKIKEHRGSDMVKELLDACNLLKQEDWFDELSATFLLKNLSDIAESDHRIEETEIHFLKNIAETFGVNAPRI